MTFKRRADFSKSMARGWKLVCAFKTSTRSSQTYRDTTHHPVADCYSPKKPINWRAASHYGRSSRVSVKSNDCSFGRSFAARDLEEFWLRQSSRRREKSGTEGSG